MIYSGTSQTVYYNVDGTAPNRTTTFEFYESHYGAPTEYYHFQILFYENLPNIVKYIYFQISDNGTSATIGTQGKLLFHISILISNRIFFLKICSIIKWTRYDLFC